MNHGEARSLYATMLAVWPTAKSQHGLDTAQAWVELIENTPADDAQAAVVELRVSVDWFPSMAQFHQCVSDARVIRAERAVERRAIDGPAPDPAGKSRIEQMTKWLKSGHKVITEKELDAAGVKNWRGRLDHARRNDERLQTNTNYDAVWAEIRSEMGLPLLTLPDGRKFG